MEENVALDTSKQKKFVKSIKGIKKLIKNKTEKEDTNENAVELPKKEKSKRKRPERGLVYLSHIPHGFYEHEMTQYFKQFGVVTNARVIRSKRTGNSKGYAFVEFRETTVAEIVAETMNNYLMGKRLIKAAYIPPEKQKKAFRKRWSRLHNPGKENRLKFKKAYNENKDEKGDLKRAKKMLANFKKTKSKLAELGISYDFFSPVDVPEEISLNLEESTPVDEKPKSKNKKTEVVQKDTKSKVKEEVKVDKTKKVKNENKIPENKVEPKKQETAKKEKNTEVVNKKEQKQKQQKLKDAGVKPPENFIQIQKESEDSDSSLEFDSDEYDKMLENDDSEVGSDDDETEDQSGSDEEESESEEEEEEEVTPPPKKVKGKKGPIIAMQPPAKKQQGKQKQGKIPEVVKRKAPQRQVSNPKKSNFEKQTQQPMKKQFKKKK